MSALPLFEKKKPRVAIHSVTGCAGCQLVIYFIRDKLLEVLGEIDLVAAPMIKSKNDEGPYDICFLEGMVANDKDIQTVKELREKSKYLVAWGTCATHGNVPGIKLFTDGKKLEKIVYGNSEILANRKRVEPTPIEKHVKVDFSISGCPPEEIEFLRLIQHFLTGIKPVIYNEPVCVECALKENSCLLDNGKECLGPMIRGGCDALCPSVNHACTGCHGPLVDANIPQVLSLLEKNGISKELVKQRLQKYAGLKFEELGAIIR